MATAAATSSGSIVVTRAYAIRKPPTPRCGSFGGFFRLPIRHSGAMFGIQSLSARSAGTWTRSLRIQHWSTL